MLLRRCPPERFFMDRKIPLNIFLIIGQSNAYGTYDVPEGRDVWDFRREQMKDAVLPKPGTVFCLTLTTSEHGRYIRPLLRQTGLFPGSREKVV